MNQETKNQNPQPRTRISNGMVLLVIGGMILVGTLYTLHVYAGRRDRLPSLLFIMVTPLVVLAGVKLFVDYAFRADRARGWVCPQCQGSGKAPSASGEESTSCRPCNGVGRILG